LNNICRDVSRKLLHLCSRDQFKSLGDCVRVIDQFRDKHEEGRIVSDAERASSILY
jgi:hypothetical protein